MPDEGDNFVTIGTAVAPFVMAARKAYIHHLGELADAYAERGQRQQAMECLRQKAELIESRP